MTWILTALSGSLLCGWMLLLICMLLRFPRKPIQIGPFKWTGLIYAWIDIAVPRALEKWIRKIHPAPYIESQLNQSKTRDQVDQWLNKQISDYLTHTVPQKWPMLSMLIGEKTQDKIQQALSAHLEEKWEEITRGICKNHLSDERLTEILLQQLTHENKAFLATHAWLVIKRAILRLTPILLALGSLLAVAGRLLYQTLSSF